MDLDRVSDLDSLSSDSDSEDNFEPDDDDNDGKSSSERNHSVNSLQLEKEKKYKRDKGPPIICLTCKTVWNKNRKGGRLFMFGGSRPFMAKFEAKFKALIGNDDLKALQKRSATKFGRSYICRECYLVVRQTYDNIRKLQRDVAKSIQRIRSRSSREFKSIEDSENSGSDQDLEISYEAEIQSKKKLPPVAERIAEKIASLTLVKINNKTPRIYLTPISAESPIGSTTNRDTSHLSLSNQMGYNSSRELIEKNQHDMHCENSLQCNEAAHEGEKCTNSVSLYCDKHNLQCESQTHIKVIPQNTSTSLTYVNSLNGDDSCPTVSDNVTLCVVQQNVAKEVVAMEHQNDHHGASIDKDNQLNKPSQAELTEILANPLLIIKSPQPVRLADVKNQQVYICGEGNCDWIFSSRFFWENHIRHYHRSGKPYVCSFDGCGRSFTGRSKLELHIRSHTDERPFICDKCGNGFRGNQELRAHRLTHTSEKPHQCLKCDKTFKLLSSLKRHLQYHDGGDFPFPCTYPECEKAFKNKYDLKCHNRLHTGEKPYRCTEPGCGMAFRIPCQYTMHKRSHTGERPFRCNIDGCSAAYISSNALQAHLLSHTSERPFCCEFCGKTFKHKMLYRMHLKKHSNPQNFVCPIEGCKEDHPDRNALNQHLASHHGVLDYKSINKKTFECKEEGCGLFYSTEGGLRYHKLRAHSEGNAVFNEEHDSRQLSCPYDKCERVYEDAGSLHDHLVKAHMPIPREKMCPLCGLAYPHKEQLDFHLNNAHNETPISNEQLKGVFVCHSERCGLRFHRLEELKHHVTWHLGNPPYRCEFNDCSRTFLLETMFNRHIGEHESQKNFTCSFDGCLEGYTSYLKVLKHSKIHYGFFRCPIDGCNKAMQTLSTARMHLLCHEKPFVCFMCGKRFCSHQQWSKHKRSHTGEKVFECKICSSQFPDQRSLKAHKQSHKGDKQYMCDECGQQFNSQAFYKNHMKTHSSDLPYLCSEDSCGRAFRDISSLRAHQNKHSKPSHLCTQCGKVYKFSVSKHKCKIKLTELVEGESKIDYLQQPQETFPVQVLQQSSVPPLPAQAMPQTSLPQSLPLQMAQMSDSAASTTAQSLPHTISLPLTLQQLPQTMIQTGPPQQAQQQFTMNNLTMLPDTQHQSYAMEVEEAARAMRPNFNAPDTLIIQQDPPQYNYIILYDRPMQQ